MTLNKWMKGPQVTYTAWKQQHRRNRAMLCRKEMRDLVCTEFNGNVQCNRCDVVKAGWKVKGLSFTLYLQFWAAHWLHCSETWKTKEKEKRLSKGRRPSQLPSFSFMWSLALRNQSLVFRARLFRDQIGKRSAKGGGRGDFPAKAW